jgi:FtsP/CotA-like multicopper oxidase with cupredoxin domain
MVERCGRWCRHAWQAVFVAAVSSCSQTTTSQGPPIPVAADELREPPVLSSIGGTLDLLVIAKPVVLAQFTPYQPTGWVYEICPRPTDGAARCPGTANNDWYGGTRLQLSPGDLIKIQLINQLPSASTAEARTSGESFLALNPTNLHLHGMLVSPNYATADDATWGDNVFVYNFNSANGRPAVDSNLHGTALFDVVNYRIRVPSGHPSGLYWFHPHIHGIIQTQIASGLSGIVTVGQISDYACAGTKCGAGTADSLSVRHLILKDAEVLKDGVLMSQIDSNFCNGAPDTPSQGGCSGVNAGYSDFSGGRWFFTINGQEYPTITVGAPEGQIWRIVNSSASVTYRLNVWDPTSQRQLLMRVVSIDGVSIDVGAGTDPSQLIEQSGNRFQPVSCPGGDGVPSAGVCTTTLHLMPSSRAEVWITYRDPTGAIIPPPTGAAAVLRTSGYQAGPSGDNWPAIDLAKVQFTQTRMPPRALSVTGQTSRLAYPQRIAEDLQAANSTIPSDANCTALVPGHKRRIFFNVTSTLPHTLGLGYEEVDQNGQPVPGTFLDVAAFDPATPTVCLPLAPGNLPAIERWELVNLSGSDHNFHIHQAHFSVLSAAEVASTAVPEQLYQRTVMMDSLPLVHADGFCASVDDWRNGTCTAHPATVEISFAVSGDFVYHCHIAEHEDGGMMAVIRVRSAAPDASSGVVSRLLSAFRISGANSRQPAIPRIGGVMCRGPRVPPSYLSSGQNPR